VKLLYDVDEASAVIGVKRTKLYQLLAAGEIESVSIGRSRRVPVEALQDYVERLRAAARDERELAGA
jgi:excisionase family DNA binding protein